MNEVNFDKWTTPKLTEAFKVMKGYSRESQKIQTFREKYLLIKTGAKSKNKGANQLERVEWFNGSQVMIYKDHHNIELVRLDSDKVEQSVLLTDLMVDVSELNKQMYVSMKEILDGFEFETFVDFHYEQEKRYENSRKAKKESHEIANAFEETNKKLLKEIEGYKSEIEGLNSDISSMGSQVKSANNKLFKWNLIASVVGATLIIASMYVDKSKYTECLNLLT